MKNAYLVALIVLILGFGWVSFCFGRVSWRHQRCIKWSINLIMAAFVLVASLVTLVEFYPEFADHLISPLNIILGVIYLLGLVRTYNRCFTYGDSRRYSPDQAKQSTEFSPDSDIPPMPTK